LTRQGMLMHLTCVFRHFSDIYWSTKVFEESLALLRTHHKNIQRYRQLLESNLTDFEREYLGKRLLEEQLAIEALSANAPSVQLA
jgi:hypothetical protein